MKKRNLLLLIPLLIFTTGCQQVESDKTFPYELKKQSQLTFKLDSTTTFENFNLFHKRLKDTDYLVTFDAGQGHINYFNLERKEFSHKQVLDRTNGPNGISQPMNIDVWNHDSIYVYDLNQGLYLINSESQVISSYNMGDLDNDGSMPGEAFFFGSHALIKSGEDMYYSTFPRNRRYNTLYKYNIGSNSAESFIPYPSGYNNDLLVNYFNVWSAFNPNSLEFATSFTLE